VLAVVAVLLASAAAPLERMSARVDVDIARENIVHALKAAQHSAVRANTPVRVFLSENTLHNRLVAGFSSHRRHMNFYYLPNYTLPEHVTVTMTEGMSMIEYLPVGRVSSMGVISLSSTIHPDYVVNIRIANLAGHLEVDEGLMQKLDRMRAEKIEL
jgi:Tfp pilus assembly protein FimT